MSETQLTRLLQDAAAGDRSAGERAWASLYDELHAMAGRELGREVRGHTLSPTGLVHEAWMKLGGADGPAPEGRRHFFALACRAMRQVLVDHARRRRAEKRGGGQIAVTLERASPASPDPTLDLLELDDAITRLADIDERLVRVVECRFFGGLSFPEISETLGIPLRTAERDWQRARTYLYRMLSPGEAGEA